MSSSTKTFVLLGLLLAIALLISSEVSASRDLLAEKEVVDVDVVQEKNTMVDDNKQGGVRGDGFCKHKCCKKYPKRCFCCKANAFGVFVESEN